jgi:hypothetical protein
MQNASPPPIDHFPAFLARIPSHIDLEALARQSKAFQRPRGVRSGTDLLRLALAWGPGGYSMQRVAAWAGERDIATLTEDALIQRLHGAVAYLEAVVKQLLTPVTPIPCWNGRTLRISDGTCLRRPGSKGTDWRIHGVYDLGSGRFTHLELTDHHGGEALDRGQPVAGEIRVADRGYANAQAWQRFRENSPPPSQGQARQADYIVRMRWSTVRLVDGNGDLFDLIDWLQTLPTEIETHEIEVRVQSGKHQTPAPIRLVVRRNTSEATEAAHKKLRQKASRRQSQIDPRSFVAAGFLIVATSLTKEEFPAGAVLAIYRLRWQIELAFKRLKSLLHIDKLRTKTEVGTRCWLYAHLIVALLGDDLSQDFLESFPSAAF